MKRNIPVKDKDLIKTLNENIVKPTTVDDKETTTVSVDLADPSTKDKTVKTTYCRDAKGRFCSAHTETVESPAETPTHEPAVRTCVPNSDEKPEETNKKLECDINLHAPCNIFDTYFKDHKPQIESRNAVEDNDINKRFTDNNHKCTKGLLKLKSNNPQDVLDNINRKYPDTVAERIENIIDEYEFVNHPEHYAGHSSVETIEKIRRIYGDEITALWCEITAFKYRDRIGYKPNNSNAQEVAKIKWYEAKAAELRKNLK